MKKLLIVGAFPSLGKKIFGGIARSCNLLVKSEQFSKFEIIRLDSSQISHPPPNFLIRLALSVLRMNRFIYEMIKHKPRVVLIFCSDGASAIEKGVMVLISHLFNSKQIIFPRAGNLINQVNNSHIMNNLIKFLFSKSDIFLCQGKKWREFAHNKLKIDISKIKIINNWSAEDDLFKIGANKVITEDTRIIKILFVGWLEKEKGVYEMINSFKQLIDKNLNIELIIVGDGSLKKIFNDLLNQKKFENKIKLNGWLSEEKLRYVYEESDIFILPSWQEGMPNSLIEATACGLPSICTDIGMVSDYYLNNEDIIIIRPKNQNILAKSLEKLINDVNLRKKLSVNGRLVSKKMFSTNTNLRKLSKIIKEQIT